MNGRVYDPVIGRFLSVDPVFQFPENTQGLNPYTYVLNSPLSHTDPTGLCQDANPCEEQSTGGQTEGGRQSKDEKTTATVKSTGRTHDANGDGKVSRSEVLGGSVATATLTLSSGGSSVDVTVTGGKIVGVSDVSSTGSPSTVDGGNTGPAAPAQTGGNSGGKPAAGGTWNPQHLQLEGKQLAALSGNELAIAQKLDASISLFRGTLQLAAGLKHDPTSSRAKEALSEFAKTDWVFNPLQAYRDAHGVERPAFAQRRESGQHLVKFVRGMNSWYNASYPTRGGSPGYYNTYQSFDQFAFMLAAHESWHTTRSNALAARFGQEEGDADLFAQRMWSVHTTGQP